jgi:YD repeat-containing protein
MSMGARRRTQYDNPQRLTQVLNQNGTSTLDQHTYTLDSVGNRTQVAEVLAQVGGGSISPTTTYSYDRLYRLLGDGTNTYAYDPVGNRLSWSSTNYSYDRADRITSAGSTTYSVNNNGNVIWRGTDSFSYDQANRLKNLTVGGVTSTYTWDGNGKRVSSTTGGTTTNFVYDVSGKLPMLLTDGTRKYVHGAGWLTRPTWPATFRQWFITTAWDRHAL